MPCQMRWFFIITVVIILTQDSFSTFNFVIVHNNDIHARFDEYNKSLDRKPVGGLARTAYKVKEFRQAAIDKTGPPVLFLNAGDTFSGTVWFSIHRWKIVSDFLNLLKPDVMCVGNHEFDDGIGNLSYFLKTTLIPVVCANCNVTLEPELHGLIKPSTIVNVSGRKVGIIGYMDSTAKDNTYCGKVTFTDEINAVRTESKKLNSDGIQIILALGHSGFEIDQRIAREVDHIDIVIGGHSNTFQWNGDQPDLERPISKYPKVVYSYYGRRVPVIQAYAYSKYLGFLNVTFNDHGDLVAWNGNPIFMNDLVPKDHDVEALTIKYKKEVDKVKTIIVGNTSAVLNSINCRYEECTFGNLIADAFVSYKVDTYKGQFWTDCAIGLVNAGSVRTSVPPGLVTLGDLLEATPYFQQLASFDISGADLVKALEVGVKASTIDRVNGEFLQVSGMKVVINRHNQRGSRVVSVDVRCSKCLEGRFYPLENDLYYKVVTNKFIADGGDDRAFLRNSTLNMMLEDVKDVEAVRKYFEKVKTIDLNVEGRVVVISEHLPDLVKNANNSFEDLNDVNMMARSSCDSLRIVVLFYSMLLYGNILIFI